MSITGVSSRFLTLRPRIQREPGIMTISTGGLSSFLSLGMSRRRVEVDSMRKEIRFSQRTAWFFVNTYCLHFDDISHLDYGYKSYGTSWGWSFSGFGRQDEVERFTLSAVDRNDDPHVICAFSGEGAVHTGWSGVLLGDDDLWDASGTQEEESRSLVDELKRLTGKPLGKPLSALVEMKACPKCGREVSDYAAKCLYCAHPLND